MLPLDQTIPDEDLARIRTRLYLLRNDLTRCLSDRFGMTRPDADLLGWHLFQNSDDNIKDDHVA